MTRKPWFWVALALLAVACAVFGFVNFPRAFPIVNLNIEMDRATALQRAAELADRHGWGPENPRSAASFDLDRSV